MPAQSPVLMPPTMPVGQPTNLQYGLGIFPGPDSVRKEVTKVPPNKNMINASQAHKILIRQGYELSYPTAIKWLKENGLARQDTVPYGTISVDRDLLMRFLKKEGMVKTEVSNPERKPPGRKKSDG